MFLAGSDKYMYSVSIWVKMCTKVVYFIGPFPNHSLSLGLGTVCYLQYMRFQYRAWNRRTESKQEPKPKPAFKKELSLGQNVRPLPLFTFIPQVILVSSLQHTLQSNETPGGNLMQSLNLEKVLSVSF